MKPSSVQQVQTPNRMKEFSTTAQGTSTDIQAWFYILRQFIQTAPGTQRETNIDLLNPQENLLNSILT